MRLALSCGATSAVACVLASFAGTGFAQSESNAEASGSPRERLAVLLEQAALADRRLDAIRDEEAANGPYSVALIDQLQSLGLLYQELGEDDLAIESITRALQVERANFGLFSLDQAPLIRQLITAERARGNLAAVGELEERLLRLARNNPSDLRSAEILREAGDRHLELYGRYLAGDVPPQVNIGVNFAGGPVLGTPPPAGRASVRRAQRHYLDAIAVVLDAGSYAQEALYELEKKLLHTYYLELTEDEPGPNRLHALSSLGHQAHERLVAYHVLNHAGVQEVVKALVELADWELLFSHNGQALERYREAYRLLAESEGNEALLEELFMPETPVVLPAFVANPLTSDDPAGDDGFVDIEFDVSRFGKSRQIDVVDASSEAAEDAARDVVRLISRSRFRPILPDGEPTRASSVVVRYRF